MDGPTSETVEHCQRSVDAARAVVDTVTPGDLDRPTPCRHWAVRDLLAHMVWMQQVFAGGLKGGEVPPEAAPVDAGDAQAFADASAEAMQAWRTVDWGSMLLKLPFSELPAAIGVRVFIGDNSIHTWDLATALGQPFEIDEDLAGPQLDLMQQFYDPTARSPDASFDLATPVPPGATTTERLIALSGRQLPS